MVKYLLKLSTNLNTIFKESCPRFTGRLYVFWYCNFKYLQWYSTLMQTVFFIFNILKINVENIINTYKLKSAVELVAGIVKQYDNLFQCNSHKFTYFRVFVKIRLNIYINLTWVFKKDFFYIDRLYSFNISLLQVFLCSTITISICKMF